MPSSGRLGDSAASPGLAPASSADVLVGSGGSFAVMPIQVKMCGVCIIF